MRERGEAGGRWREGRSNEEGWRGLRGDGFYLEKFGGLKINGEGANFVGAEVKQNKRNKKKNIFGENRDMWVGLKKKCRGKVVIMIQY